MKYIILKIITFIICFLLICGCSGRDDEDILEHNSNSSTNSQTFTDNVSPDDFVLFESNQNYEIFYKSRGMDRYKTLIFNNNKELVDVLYTHREPNVFQISYETEKALGFWAQAGSDISTRWAVFYDLTNGNKSEEFHYYLDATDSKVVTAKKDRVIIQDIFDSNKYYKEITSFAENIDLSSANIFDAKFISNGTKLSITYRVNPNESKTEIFDLTK